MSRENVEIVRRAYIAWERDGIDGVMPFADEQIELQNPAEGVGGSFHGHQGVREWTRQVTEAFEEVHFEPERIEEVSDGRLVATLNARVKGRGSGIEMEVPFAHVIEMRAGKVVALTQYTSIEAALKAVGLEE